MDPKEEEREEDPGNESKWGKIALAILKMRETSFKRILKKVTDFGKDEDSVDNLRSSPLKYSKSPQSQGLHLVSRQFRTQRTITSNLQRATSLKSI